MACVNEVSDYGGTELDLFKLFIGIKLTLENEDLPYLCKWQSRYRITRRVVVAVTH